MFLGKAIKKYSRRISAIPSKQFSIKNQLRVKVYCNIHPTQLSVNFDSGFVNGDPLRPRLRRVWNAVSNLTYLFLDRLMRAFYAEESKSLLRFSERITDRMEPDGERPDGLHKSKALVNVAVRFAPNIRHPWFLTSL